MTSKMDDVISALSDRFSVLSGITGVVTLFDGPPVGDPAAGDYLFLGDNADPESDVESVFTQQWVDLAHTRRDEIGEIICAVVSDSGSIDLRTLRTHAFSVFGLCESALITDPTFGGLVYTSEMIAGQARPLQNDRGSAVVIPFTVQYWAPV